jgi:hypothetical protein
VIELWCASSEIRPRPGMAKHSVYDRAAEKRPVIKERSAIQILYLHIYNNIILYRKVYYFKYIFNVTSALV